MSDISAEPTSSSNQSMILSDSDEQQPRRTLIAYPISAAQRDTAGRLTLNPAALPAPLAPAAVTDSPDEPAATPRQLALLLVVGVVTILIDQWSKRLVEANMPLYTEFIPIEALMPFFRFTHTANFGAAFGMFQSGGFIFGAVAAIVAIAIIVYNFQLPAGNLLLRTALGLQLGGALGNLIDRLRLGYVTDFFDIDVSSIIDIPYISDWPIFNVADMAIVGGVIMLAYIMITEEIPDAASARSKRNERVPAMAVVGADEAAPINEPLNEAPAAIDLTEVNTIQQEDDMISDLLDMPVEFKAADSSDE